MLNKENAYFLNLKRLGHEYEEARAERRARKQQIIDTLGWESEELKAWYEEDAAAQFPLSQGACKAYRAWVSSLRLPLGERSPRLRRSPPRRRDRHLCLHQPVDGGDGESPRLCRRGLRDDRPLHDHPPREPLGQRGAHRNHGHPLQPFMTQRVINLSCAQAWTYASKDGNVRTSEGQRTHRKRGAPQ